MPSYSEKYLVGRPKANSVGGLSGRSNTEEFGHRLRARVDVEFLVGAAYMGADGAHAQIQFVRDFLVTIAVRQESQDLLFPGRQPDMIPRFHTGLK